MNLQSPLQHSFLANKTVLITGGTGFLGTAIIELMLRDHHPHLNCIYVLIRPSKSKSVEERLKDLMLNRIFTTIQDTMDMDAYWKMVTEKVIPVKGDITKPKLGICDNDYALITKNVNYVIHCAASVRFDIHFRDIFQFNVMPTQEILQLCDDLDNCDGFQHVSTAYVNSFLPSGTVLERIYPMAIDDCETLMITIPRMSDDEIETLKKRILQKYPNLYTFTKSLSEHQIIQHVEMMRNREIKIGKRAWPVSIVRPSVVSGAAKTPTAGWMEGMMGSASTVYFLGLGVIDSIIGNPDNINNLVPVDYLVYVMISALAATKSPGINFQLPYANTLKDNSRGPLYPKIYHCSTSASNPNSNKLSLEMGVAAFNNLPPLKGRFFKPRFIKYSNEKVNTATFWIRMRARLGLLGAMAMMTQPTQLRKLKKLQSKLNYMVKCLKYFWSHSWVYDDANARELDSLVISKEFRNKVTANPFPVAKLMRMDWQIYLTRYVYGIMYFVLKQSSDIRIPVKARKPVFTSTDSTVHENDLLESCKLSDQSMKIQDRVIDKKYIPEFVQSRMITHCIALTAVEFQCSYFQVEDKLIKRLTNLHNSNFGYGFTAEHRFVNKFFDRSFSEISIDHTQIGKLKDALHNSDHQTAIIYIPTCMSSLDTVILSHILEKYNLPLPQAISEANDKLVTYQLVNNLTILKKSTWSADLFPSASIRRTIAAMYLSNVLQHGASITLIPDPIPGDQADTSMLSHLIDVIRTDDSFPSVCIVPVTINYDSLVDRDYCLENYLNIDSSTLKQKFTLTLPPNRTRCYVSFGDPIPVNQFSKSTILRSTSKDNQELIESQVFDSLRQHQVIAPINIFALILVHYQIMKSTLNFYECRRLMLFFKSHIKKLGNSVDWSDVEDTNAVVYNTISVMGNLVAFVDKLDGEKIIQIDSSADSVMILKYLARPLLPIVAGEALWFLAYNTWHKESALKSSTLNLHSNGKVLNSLYNPKWNELCDEYATQLKLYYTKCPKLFQHTIIQSIDENFEQIHGQLIESDLVMMNADNTFAVSKLFIASYLSICASAIQDAFCPTPKFELMLLPPVGEFTSDATIVPEKIDNQSELQPKQKILDLHFTRMSGKLDQAELDHFTREIRSLIYRPNPEDERTTHSDIWNGITDLA